ncbi:MAG TPA: hypothetical protein VLI94_05785 [Solirubrobacterales bacterium]|nr:hypothetical protein [Solirubrobacterales bacterium]
MKRAAQASPSEAVPERRSLPGILAKMGIACVVSAALVGFGGTTATAACPNEQFRVGPSADLPDCRAYELVTPANNNRTFFAGTGTGAFPVKFSSSPVSPSGEGYLWTLFAASVAGSPSNGSSNLFEAQRTGSGWNHKFLSPTPLEAEISNPGSADPAHQFITFQVEDFRGGSMTGCNCPLSSWVRYPNGSFRPLGEGTIPVLGTDADGYQNGFDDDLDASAYWIAPNGSHQIFEANVALTPEAPPGTLQVYDRTGAGLKLVSLLPGEAPPATDSFFAGSAADGSTILFTQEGNLYARVDNAESVLVASALSGPITPGGVNFDGSKVFFVQEGNVSYYDVEAEEVKGVVAPGDAVLAYVSPDGSHVFFLSGEELVPGQGALGSPNLYVWDGTSVKFIGTVTAEDLAHSESGGGQPFAGLELWAKVEPNPVAQNKNFLTATARTTFDGEVFVFESRAQLTDYPNAGHVEIYRYVVESEELECVSCGPGEPASAADSNLVFLQTEGALGALNPMHEISNLSADGSRVVFESRDALLPADVNGVRDVYQWNDGALSLISTGHAPQPSGVVGVSSTGSDIFIQTAERLVAQGQDSGSFAIYDARVNGGLASQQAISPIACEGEGCLGMPAAPPGLAAPASSQFHGKGNVKPRRCQKHGKQRQKRGENRQHKKKKACRAKGRKASK